MGAPSPPGALRLQPCSVQISFQWDIYIIHFPAKRKITFVKKKNEPQSFEEIKIK